MWACVFCAAITFCLLLWWWPVPAGNGIHTLTNLPAHGTGAHTVPTAHGRGVYRDIGYSSPSTHVFRGTNGDTFNPIEGNCRNTDFILEDFAVCGDGYCRCRNDTADCTSYYYGKLSYIPALPANISTLIFSWQGLTAISRDDFFENVTNIVSLDLYANKLSFISPGAFRPLEKLKELHLQENNLTYSALAPVLSVTSLTLLDISSNPLGSPPEGLFHNYTLPRLHTLCLGPAGMYRVSLSVFKALPSLNHLDLAYNSLSKQTMIPDFLPQLNYLILWYNSFREFPETCQGSASFLPNLIFLNLSSNPLKKLPSTLVCLPRLQMFICLDSYISRFPDNVFGQHLFPSLQMIYLGSRSFLAVETIGTFAFNNTMLNFIILTGGIDFSKDSIHPDFTVCTGLEILELPANDFSKVSQHKLRRLLTHDHVSLLRLTECQLGHIGPDMFDGLPKLTGLWLRHNQLTDIPDGVFDKLQHLGLLDLSYNQLSVFRETTLSPATRQRLIHVDLSNNRFQCGCDLRWFQGWLLSRPDVFSYCDIEPCGSYTCDNLVNTTVQSFYVADQACLWSPAVSKFIIASLILLVIPVTVFALVYRYRWHIRLLLFEAARGRDDRRRHIQEQHYRYDVFVSYDSNDIRWVQAHLIPQLEGRLGLRLCIHQRDFTPGAPIVQNIEESVQSSKKSIMVFSRNFAHSPWCQFELHLCLTHVLEHGDNLVVVLLEDIPSRDLTPAMIAVMKTMTYIEWGDDPEARASFWGRVRLGLNEILA